MEEFPDSSLTLLQQIKNPDKLSVHEYALYTLLLTQAIHKSGIDETSDSLIIHAIDYFKNTSEYDRLAKAYYYQAIIASNSGDSEKAIYLYLQAIANARKGNDAYYLGRTYLMLGDLYFSQGLYKQAMEYHTWARPLIEEKKKVSSLVHLFNSLFFDTLLLDDTDSTTSYANQYLNWVEKQDDKELYGHALRFCAIAYSEQKLYKEALNYALEAQEYLQDIDHDRLYAYTLGIIYYDMRNYSQARQHLEYVLESPIPSNQAGTYNLLYLIEKKEGNYESALKYNELHDIHKDSILAQEHADAVFEIEQKYENEKLYNENIQLKYHHIKRLTISGVLLLLILIILLLLIRKYIRQQQVLLLNKKTIEANKALIADKEKELNRLRSLPKAPDNTQAIYELQTQISTLISENYRLKTVYNSKETISLLKKVNEEQILLQNMTEQEWITLYTCTNMIYGEFTTRLRKQYPKLTLNNLQILVLIRLGFSVQSISVLKEIEPRSGERAVERLGKFLDLPPNKDIYAFIREF